MPCRACAVFVLFFLLSGVSEAYKSAEIPLYRKDTPYCMRSFRETGDFKYRDVWFKIPREAEDAPPYDWLVMDKKNPEKVERDEYHMSKLEVESQECNWYNMTAVQIDLGTQKRIAGVVVLGDNRPDKTDKTAREGDLWTNYVSHYTVEHSPDGRIWAEIMDEHGRPRDFKVTQHYEENAIAIDREEGLPRAHLQTFDPNIHARYIRLNIEAYVRNSCIRFVDVFGCDSEMAKNNAQRVEEPNRQLKDEECSFMNPLGMESGEIKDHQIEASSYRKPSEHHKYYPHYARWGRTDRIWCSSQDPMVGDRTPWIRVRISSWPKYISYIRYEKETISHDMRIEYSMDGTYWIKYSAQGKAVPDSYLYPYIVYWLIPPRKARYVRFLFTRSAPIGPFKACLRFEIHGCSAETQSIAYQREKTRRVPAVLMSTPSSPGRFRINLRMEGDPYFAWCAKYKSKAFFNFGDPRIKETKSLNYLTIDLTKIFAISKLVIQGDNSKEKGCAGYTTTISFMHSTDFNTWVLTRDYNGKNDFKFRTRRMKAVQSPCGYASIDITPTAYARYLLFVPQYYHEAPCLRILLVGYEPGTQPRLSQKPRKTFPACSTPLGMEKGVIKDKYITASSYLKGGERTQGRYGRLEQKGGWCVSKMKHFTKFYALNDSLEINLQTERIIDGFSSQGYSDAMKKRWVTAYVVHYSQDGVSWGVVSMREQERVFLANSDPHTVVRQYLNPRVRARKIRFVPVAWHNWVCMRVEIYGCDDGKSSESILEDQLRNLETKKLALVSLVPDEQISLNCGDYETWGQTNYLKVNLDKTKSTWYQKTFNKDFPLVEKTLTLATNQFPSDFGSRHFMCIGRTRDGVDMFWQHLIAAPKGPRVPYWLAPYRDMKNSDSADIPQIVVLQRFDPSYDGGNPLWSEPAVVYASGNIATIAVYVIGIPFYPITIHNCLIEDRLLDWHFTNLGTVPKNDYRACAQLALSRGYEYMSVLGATNCLSSWYLPLATSPHRPRDEGQCRLEPRVYFINATFEEYRIRWYRKAKGDDHTWTTLTSYLIRPKMKSSPHISVFGDDPDEYKEMMKRFSDGGRYQTFDKPLFGDTYTGSHVIEIMDMTIEDLGSYKFEVFVPSRKVRNEVIIELRHEREPQIDLPTLYEACQNVPGPLTVKAVDTDLLDPEVWEPAKWYHTIFVGHKIKARYSSTTRITYKTKGIWNENFVWTEPDSYVNGEYFEVFAQNRYGLTTGLSEIAVVGKDETPSIEWITPSPFEAVDGLRQTLQVKLKTDKQLNSVTWYHDGKPIEAATDRYGFPESTAGVRKKLKLIKIDEATPGKYKVIVKGKSCAFERTVTVRVIVIPRVYFKPQADYVIAKETDLEVVFNATVKGGSPKPKIQQMKWKKGSSTLVPSYGERVVLFTTLDEDLNWLSVLKVRKLRPTDSADYTFELVTGPAVTKKTWRLSVQSSDDKNSNSIPTEVGNTKTSTPSSDSSKAKITWLHWILCTICFFITK